MICCMVFMFFTVFNVVFYVFKMIFHGAFRFLVFFHDCLQFSYGNMIIECLCFYIFDWLFSFL